MNDDLEAIAKHTAMVQANIDDGHGGHEAWSNWGPKAQMDRVALLARVRELEATIKVHANHTMALLKGVEGDRRAIRGLQERLAESEMNAEDTERMWRELRNAAFVGDDYCEHLDPDQTHEAALLALECLHGSDLERQLAVAIDERDALAKRVRELEGR